MSFEAKLGSTGNAAVVQGREQESLRRYELVIGHASGLRRWRRKQRPVQKMTVAFERRSNRGSGRARGPYPRRRGINLAELRATSAMRCCFMFEDVPTTIKVGVFNV